MYAVAGITGQVGGIVAESLIKLGRKVRAVVRDAGKGQALAKCGCEVAVATIEDAVSLSRKGSVALETVLKALIGSRRQFNL